MGARHGAHRPRAFDAVDYLAGTYFHQDHDLEASEPLGVVRSFRDAEGEEEIGALRRQVVRLLADPRGDEALAEAWKKSSYDPRRHGSTLRAWFEAVVGVLDGR